MVRNQRGVKSVSQRIRRDVRADVDAALRELSLWSYGEVYEISLIRKNKAITRATEIYDLSTASCIASRLIDGVTGKD